MEPAAREHKMSDVIMIGKPLPFKNEFTSICFGFLLFHLFAIIYLNDGVGTVAVC